MLLNTSGLRRRKPLFRDGCFFRQSVRSVIHAGTGMSREVHPPTGVFEGGCMSTTDILVSTGVSLVVPSMTRTVSFCTLSSCSRFVSVLNDQMRAREAVEPAVTLDGVFDLRVPLAVTNARGV